MHDDFMWFEEHYAELQKKYGDSFLAIKKKHVIGSYKTYADGVSETLKTESIGTFIVQQCNSSGEPPVCKIASMNFV